MVVEIIAHGSDVSNLSSHHCMHINVIISPLSFLLVTWGRHATSAAFNLMNSFTYNTFFFSFNLFCILSLSYYYFGIRGAPSSSIPVLNEHCKYIGKKWEGTGRIAIYFTSICILNEFETHCRFNVLV